MVQPTPTLDDNVIANISQSSRICNNHFQQTVFRQAARLESPAQCLARSMDGMKMPSLTEWATADSGLAKHADIIRKVPLQI